MIPEFDDTEIIKELDKIIALAKVTEGAGSIVVVLLALTGSIKGELDEVFATEVQKIVREKLLPLIQAEKEQVRVMNELNQNITYPKGLTGGINYN